MAKGGKFADTNGKREPGKMHKISGPPKILAAAKKTSSSGFKDGGTVNRARGGRTSAPFSSAGGSSARSGSSTSGHESE
jgi:hypothetical protein